MLRLWKVAFFVSLTLGKPYPFYFKILTLWYQSIMKQDYTIQGFNNQMSVQILDEKIGNFDGFEAVEKPIFDPNLGQKVDKFNDIKISNNIVPGDGGGQFSFLEIHGKKRTTFEAENGLKKPTFLDLGVTRFELQNQARLLLPEEAVARCLRLRKSKLNPVEIHKPLLFDKAFYGNLQTCKSVWSCPVCASKISERRRAELQQGVLNWPGSIFLLTLTLQHSANEGLEPILTSLLSGYTDDFTRGGAWTRLERKYGILGRIRTLECTYGNNGFHPHLHGLLFSERKDIDVVELRNVLFDRWETSLKKLGRYTNIEAFNLKYGHKNIWSYVTKWGMYSDERLNQRNWTISHEMTKSVVKRAKKGGYTPFALLESSLNGNKAHGKLFQEYFTYFKSSQQLRYTPGLKELLGLTEKTDAQICDEKIEQAYLFMVLNMEQWRQVLDNEIRAELLHEVAAGDLQSVVAYLSRFGIEWE